MCNPQPSDGLAHLGSHALHLTSSLQVPGIVDDPDEAEGVCMVGYDASASFEGVKDTQEALVVETAGTEALKPCSLSEAINAKQQMSHPFMQEPTYIGSINPDGHKPFATPEDHSVTLPIDRAPVSATEHAITCDMPYHKAIGILFAAASGPTHSESVKQIPLNFSDTSDPPFTHSSTAKD